jgi:hypothetical protein
MEVPKANSLYSYPKQEKMSSFSFFLFSYINQRTGGWNRSLKGLVPVGMGRRWGKGVGGSIWYKCCVHVYVIRKISFRTILGMGEGEIKENGGGGGFKYDILRELL